MGESTQPAKRTWIGWTAGALALVVAGVAGYRLLTGTKTPEPRPADVPPVVAAPEPLPSAPLPPMDDSDAQLRAAFGEASADGRFRGWLAQHDLVTRLVAAVDAAAEGRVARRQLEFLAPKGPFQTREAGGREFIEAKSYARYDTFADVVATLDVQKLAAAWRGLEPLLTAGYRAFGYPDRTIGDVLRPALDRITRTRVLAGDVEVVPRGGIVKFADPALEGASDLEKQLWRLGPDNQRRVQEKARAFAAALGAR